MEIIVFEKKAYYKMLGEIKQTIVEAVTELKKDIKVLPPKPEEWISAAKAQVILNCKKDRLRKNRENGDIKSTPKGKHYLYLKSSLYDYLNKNSFE